MTIKAINRVLAQQELAAARKWAKASTKDKEDWDAYRVIVYKEPGKTLHKGDFYISIADEVVWGGFGNEESDEEYPEIDAMRGGAFPVNGKRPEAMDKAKLAKMQAFFQKNKVPAPPADLLKWVLTASPYELDNPVESSSVDEETAGSWGKKPLETDGTSGAFNQVYERFEKLLVYAEREAFKSFMKPDNDDNNMFPSGVGFVVFMMQHNAFMSPGLRAAAIGWAKNAKTRPALKFGEMVRTYKPTLRRDLGVTVAILEAYSSGRLKAE